MAQVHSGSQRHSDVPPVFTPRLSKMNERMTLSNLKGQVGLTADIKLKDHAHSYHDSVTV
jgi:hypothetical protein